MKRNDYKPKNHKRPSVLNEPANYINMLVNYDKAPDMYELYKKFEILTGRKNFILTSGCEAALKAVLLTLKPKKFLVESPGWGMPNVIGEALDIETKKFYPNFTMNEKSKISFTEPFVTLKDDELIYTTETFNNLYRHENDLELHTNNGYLLRDVTYTMDPKTWDSGDRYFYMGSFSKIAGCGLRLGFLIFPEQFKDKINMLREQYVNSGAEQYLIGLKEFPKFKERQYEKGTIWNHPVYSIYKKEPQVQHKKFMIANKEYYRVGI